MASGISLGSVPIVDDHCHASMYEQRDGTSFRTIRQHQESYARGFLEARIPPESWRDYVGAMQAQDGARLEELDRRHGVRDMMERSLQLHSTMVFARALEIGCTELYGEWEDRERLAEMSAQARSEGVVALYKRVLDRLNCRVAFADAPRLDPAMWPRDRFRWIARFDPFLYPFGPGSNSVCGTEVPAFYAKFANKLNLALQEQGLDDCPTDLADYLDFAGRAVESFLERGAVAFKVVSAYVRSLEFRPVSEAEAARVFRDLARGQKGESRVFEDFMARHLLLWAAERGVPVQFHVGMGHAEPGMDFSGVGPMALQIVLMDERYSNLKMVILHGGYPYCSEAAALTWTNGNLHLDFSWMCYVHHHYLIDRLSEWLELLPGHKLLLGGDTGLPELHLGALRLGVRAIEAALNRGVEAGIRSTTQAHQLGERICYRNACDLYGISV